ncbi:MAG: alpha/beta hydrolase [Chloroflexota bacterium]|nr:alpha/beta hydrolase [Chloroflexota bacterium]
MSEAPRSSMRPRTVRAGDVSLAVAEYPGEGPPVVLLHGIGSRGVSWWPVIDGLTPFFHLYVLDLRGHGDSSKPVAGYDGADYVDDLKRALDGLGLERPRIIGHSLGALVTLAWASLHPARAAALVLEDPPLRTMPRTLELFDEWIALAAMPPAEVAELYRDRYPAWSAEERARRAGSITGTAPAVFQEARARAERTLRSPGEHRVPLSRRLPPTLLVAGDVAAGGLLLPADADHFAVSVPRSEVVHFPGVGHSPHRDVADEFLAVVVPFMRAAG